MNIVILSQESEPHAGGQLSRLGRPDFEGFFTQYYASTVRLLSAGGEHAEDAVQEAFTQAYLHWPKVSTYDRPDAWVLRVAVNRMLNERRRLLRRERNAHRLAERAATEAESGRDDLAAAIRLLPPRQRMALTLRYLANLEIAEVARAMEISEGAVRFHLHEARATLRERLTRLGERLTDND